jgi:hypothetical protein
MASNIFSEAALTKVIRAGDSKRFNIDLAKNRDAIVQDAVSSAASNTIKFLPFFTTPIKGRPCISTKHYSTQLVFRSISRYLMRRFHLKLPNREEVVLGVIKTLSDATPMYIVRRDISSFYENLPLNELQKQLLQSTTISLKVRYYVQMYFNSYCGAVGLPRGHVLSAVLAEIAMREFDHRIRNTAGVYRYYRYSDDILLFAFQPPAEIISLMTQALPAGLSFNASKSDVVPVSCFDKTNESLLSFEYLGYKFSLPDYSKGRDQRTVHVSIADRKIAKLKTRIILSLKKFRRDLDVRLLRDRLCFLSGNYRVQRTGLNAIKTSKHVKSGIFYSYRLCGTYSSKGFQPHDCDELKRLDGFYSSLVSGSNSEFTTLLRASFPQPTYDALRRISFFKGFSLKRSVRFKAPRVHEIKSVWRSA